MFCAAIDETADAVKAAGANVLRGGAFKPRTSPYSFQGLGLHGLRFLAEARERTGLPVVTEVLDPRDVAAVAEHAAVLQIGARNMQNFPLLREVGRQRLPVLLKEGAQVVDVPDLNAFYETVGGRYEVLTPHGDPLGKQVNVFMNRMLEQYSRYFNNWSLKPYWLNEDCTHAR
jgi:3-deoxy-7-phosphoheptulonate synthase